MRALLTGAGGFCGKHLRSFLETQGVEVCSIGTGQAAGVHYQVDATDVSSLIRAVDTVKPDYVFHMAGVARAEDPALYYQINTCYAAGLLQALEMTGQSHCPVLLAGSAAEYGEVPGDRLPITEDIPARPEGHYGISKLAQTMMGLWSAKRGRPRVMVRPFNIIGPGMPDHISVQSFVSQIRDAGRGSGPPVLQVGYLNGSRDFIDVRDVVKIYWRLIRKAEAYGQVINVCSGKPVVIRDLLSRLIEISGVMVEVRFDSQRSKEVDVPLNYGSTEKLKRISGIAPSESLDSSLARIWEVMSRTG
jgi:nucleoside-diphosphate-sugar epimerase